MLEAVYMALFTWAQDLSGYHVEMPYPNVVMVPHQWLEDTACGGNKCKVLGLHMMDGNVYLDQRLNVKDDIYASGILVHEFVHYLQYVTKDITTEKQACQEYVKMEKEAYTVQNIFMEKKGDIYRHSRPPPMHCDNEPSAFD